MITISKAYQFDAAHQLVRTDWSPQKNQEVFGKCYREHGHTYRLEVYIGGDVDPVTGMILNYFLLDACVKPIVDKLDHVHLNWIFDTLTTAENMVGIIATWIQDELRARYDNVFLTQVTLQETPKTKAVWNLE